MIVRHKDEEDIAMLEQLYARSGKLRELVQAIEMMNERPTAGQLAKIRRIAEEARTSL